MLPPEGMGTWKPGITTGGTFGHCRHGFRDKMLYLWHREDLSLNYYGNDYERGQVFGDGSRRKDSVDGSEGRHVEIGATLNRYSEKSAAIPGEIGSRAYRRCGYRTFKLPVSEWT